MPQTYIKKANYTPVFKEKVAIFVVFALKDRIFITITPENVYITLKNV